VGVDLIIVVLGVYLGMWAADVQAARERGEMPPPVLLRVSGSDTPPKSPCQGMLQGQLAELMDPALLFELCFYNDERDGTGQKFVRYTAFTENGILPRMKEDPRVFYIDGKRLKPVFDAHMDQLRAWRRDITTLHQWARCLDERLGERGLEDPAGSRSEARSTSGARGNALRDHGSLIADH
jgi:hypothetical protein